MSVTKPISGGGGGESIPQATHIVPVGWWQNLFPLGGEQGRANRVFPSATLTNKYVWCLPFIPENNVYDEFYMYFGAELVGDAEFGIYAVDANNRPTGTPIYTDIIPSGSNGATYITMSIPWNLTAGKKYMVAIYFDSDNGSPTIQYMSDHAALTVYSNPQANIGSCAIRMTFVDIASLALCDASTIDFNNTNQFTSLSAYMMHVSLKSEAV